MKLEADVSCPSCGRKFKQRVGEMRPGRSRRCPRCNADIRFTGDDGSKVQKAVDDLEKTIKNLNRRFGR